MYVHFYQIRGKISLIHAFSSVKLIMCDFDNNKLFLKQKLKAYRGKAIEKIFQCKLKNRSNRPSHTNIKIY